MNEATNSLSYPEIEPIYDINKSYLDNLHQGPFFKGPLPSRRLPPESEWIDFLGYKVASPIGVPAGPLLSSPWIQLASSLGFDILTYKTIRSHSFPSHPLPNIVYVATKTSPYPKGFLSDSSPLPAQKIPSSSSRLSNLTITNSFGNPSMSPDFLAEDIAKANRSLSKGQVMIVSVFGSKDSGKSLLEDFVAAALFAKDAGAKIIEANFSCPNIDLAGGAIYRNAPFVFELSQKIAQAIQPIPLVIKVGLFKDEAEMKSVMIVAAKAGVQGFSGLNTVSLDVVDNEGKAALSNSRLRSGVCGSSIRKAAIEFVKKSSEINQEEKLGLTLIGLGGVIKPNHFDLFFDAGADIAMSATGMMWNPYLAMDYHKEKMRGCKQR